MESYRHTRTPAWHLLMGSQRNIVGSRCTCQPGDHGFSTPSRQHHHQHVPSQMAWTRHPRLSTDLRPRCSISYLSMIFLHAIVLGPPASFFLGLYLPLLPLVFPVVTMFSKAPLLITWSNNNGVWLFLIAVHNVLFFQAIIVLKNWLQLPGQP